MPSCDNDLLRFAGIGVLLGIAGFQALRLLKNAPKSPEVVIETEESGSSPSPRGKRECLTQLDATLEKID